MGAARELFTTTTGLLSLGTIAFMVAMAAFIFVWVRRKIADDEHAHQGQH